MSSMLAAFSAEGFDERAWANAACSQKPHAEPLDKYLAELEMRLHLMAEELDAAIEDESARALLRVPGAVQEVSHLKVDASNLQKDVRKTLQSLTASADAAEQNVATLAALDLGKQRMETTCTTLKEATELAGLFQKVEPVFASGNLQRVAAHLTTMRRSLQHVGNIPEFDGGQDKLQALEERFRSLLEPQLSAAFAARNGELVQQLSELLDGAGDSAVVNRMYASSAASVLQKVWEKYDERRKDEPIWSWLPLMHDELIAAIASEVKWTLQNLPDHYPAIIISLLHTFFLKHQSTLTQQMSSNLHSVTPQSALDQMAKLLTYCSKFLADIQAKLSSALPEDLKQLWFTIQRPLDKQVDRYAEYEQQLLNQSLQSLLKAESLSTVSSSVAEGLQRAVEHAIKLVQTAAQRCIRFTQSTELDRFIAVADQALSQFSLTAQAAATGLGREVMESTSGSTQSSVDTSGMLPILNVAESYRNQVAMLDARFRGYISDLREDFAKDFGGPENLSPAHVRLHSSEGNLHKRLVVLTSTTEDPRHSTLTTATAGAKELGETVQGIVFDLLMHKLRAELQGVATLSVWSDDAPESKYNLPSFSAFPQGYATASGEYLMMLPQMLEALVTSSEASLTGEPGLDSDWLDKIAIGAAELFVKELRGIQRLTQHGSLQLAADLEYFCNVLHALGVAIPPEIATWQITSQWSDEDFPRALAEATEDGVLDKSTVQRVTSIRKLT